MEIQIQAQPTPNPDAMKFIVNQVVKTEGKVTYNSAEECHDNAMARALFMIEGVTQLHFFDNVITVTKTTGDWDIIEPQVFSVVQTRMPIHNPNFAEKQTESDRRKNLPPELLKIEEILDRTIRPGLRGDGGDLEVVRLENNFLYIQYQGACGSCPSASSVTLDAIEGILQAEYDPKIRLIPV